MPLRCWMMHSTRLHFPQQQRPTECLRIPAFHFHFLDRCADSLNFVLLLAPPGRLRMGRPSLKRRVQSDVAPGSWSRGTSPPASMRRTGLSVRTMTGWATSLGDGRALMDPARALLGLLCFWAVVWGMMGGPLHWGGMGKCPGERQEAKRSCSETKGERKKRQNSLEGGRRLGKISLKEKGKIEKPVKRKIKVLFMILMLLLLELVRGMRLKERLVTKGNM